MFLGPNWESGISNFFEHPGAQLTNNVVSAIWTLGFGRAGGAGPTRCRRSELGRVRFDPGQPRVQQLAGAADANPWCQTLPAGTSFEAAQVSLVRCAVPARHGSNGSGSALSTQQLASAHSMTTH